MNRRVAPRQYEGEVPAYAAPLIGFRSKKAAQLAAYFVDKAGGCIDKLKLIKLLYLAERKHLADYEMPMLLDELYSLPHGPICSSSLNAIDGTIHDEIWGGYIARHGRDRIFAVKNRVEREELDELSEADLEIADETWSRFGEMRTWQLRNWTHDNCPEYTEVSSGRVPISYQQVLEAVGVSNAADIDREIASLRREESALQL